jgi:hypothetical protein
MTPREHALPAQSPIRWPDTAYVFVSYAHVDRPLVRPYLLGLQKLDLRLWWDDGLAPDSEWAGAVADAIAGCSAFLFLVTRSAANSEYCFREVRLAHNRRIPTVVNYLESARLPTRLSALLSRVPAVTDGPCGDDVVVRLHRSLRSSYTRRPCRSQDNAVRDEWIRHLVTGSAPIQPT